MEKYDLYFYDDVKGCSGIETGFQLPHRIVGETLKLVEKLQEDANDELLVVDNSNNDNGSPIVVEEYPRKQRKSVDENPYPEYAESIPISKLHLSDTSNCCYAIKDHLAKLDELFESRLVLEELLNTLMNNEDGVNKTKV